jgi:micrococcal nuclease
MLLCLAPLLFAATAWAERRDVAAEDLAALPELRRGAVASVTDGATLVLADGTAVRLAGIEPPLAPPGGTSSWEDAARAQLTELVAGHEISLRGAKPGLDRYGRVTAQLLRDDGVWLEGALLEAGAVRVETVPPAPALAEPMLQREARARRLHLGLWNSPFYAVRTPDQLEHEGGSFVLVEAQIASVEDRHGIVWLDLGDNAAARLDRPARKLFEAAGLDPASLTGKRVRLRGWVRWQGRPILELTHPEAVERLPPEPRRED